jgi:glyoxylase-like metal-dependent hydrolase (beta-lactamase superfamily II)
MRIHHLNCGTDCPVGGWLFDGRRRGLFAQLVCHCLMIETNAGLVLVDTGYGLQDVRRPFPRLSRLFATLLNIQFREEETAIRQVEAAGFSPRDVRHILVTHLDFDHAGGLEDFPEATVHVMATEFDTARYRRNGFIAANRYRPAQFDDVRHWRSYGGGGGDSWYGFDAVRDLEGLPPEILMIPLPGHTLGHAGIAVREANGWLLHAGDAYFYREEVRRPDRRCTPGLRFYQTLMEVDRASRLRNQARLRALSIEHADEVRLICGHDPVEFERSAERLSVRSGSAGMA